MPSRGDKEHEYLKKMAMRQIVEIYGDKIDFIKNEQPQNGYQQNYMKINVSIGSAFHDLHGSGVMAYPDIIAQVRLTPEDKKVIAKEREKYIESLDAKERYGVNIHGNIPDVRILIVECETKKSDLVKGALTRRYNGYSLLRSQHPMCFTFILATFKDINVKTDLFEPIWKFPRREIAI